MLDKLTELKEKINTDVYFRKEAYGEYLTGDVTLGFAEKFYTLAFCKGHLVEITRGMPITGIDICISGPEDGWKELFQHRNYHRAVNPLHGKLKVQGNFVKYQGSINAIAHMCRQLCELV